MTNHTGHLGRNRSLIALGTLLATMNTVCFYLIIAYMPTLGGAVLHLAAKENMIVTLCFGASNFFWLPTMGAVSE